MIITQVLNISINFIYCGVIIIRGGGGKCVWVAKFLISLVESSG